MEMPLEILVLVGLGVAALYLVASALFSRLYFVVDDPLFLVLHTLLELASILVSFSVFVVNWEASKQNRNARSLFVATGFLAVAALDTMHVLSYQGMPDFLTPNSVDKSIYYWLAARFWASGLLLTAAYVRPDLSGWFVRRRFLVGLNAVACLVPFVAVTFFEGTLPILYIEGQGPTGLKVVVEYGIITVCLAAVAAHLRAYRSSRDEAMLLLVAALMFTVFSGVMLTLYRVPSDAYSVLGHLYKVIAYYLIFRALLVGSVERPYRQLRVAKERLEQTVAELDSRNRELDALDDVAVALSSTLKLDQVVQSAVEKAMAVMQARGGAVFLLMEGDVQPKLVAWKGLAEDVVGECLSYPSRLPFGSALPHGPSGAVTALDDPSLVRSLGGVGARIGPLEGCLCAPVVSKGKLLGAMAMVAESGRAFSPRDADLLTAIGYQVGLAVENAWLYERTDERLREKLEELRRAERRARLLSDAGAALGSSADLARALDLVVGQCTEVMGDWCAILLLDENGDTLRVVSGHHPDDESMRALRQVLSDRPLGVGEGLLGRAVRVGQPILAEKVTSEEITGEVQRLARSIEEVALFSKLAPTSFVAAPMRARGRIIGLVMAASTRSEKQMGATELALITELADRVAVAVENSRLFQESQAQRKHLEAVISQMVDGVVISDSTGRIAVANASAQEMLGGRIVQLIAQHGESRGTQLPNDGTGPSTGLPLLARALSGELVVGVEIVLQVGAQERVLSASGGPVRDERGEIAGAVVVLRDVTAEREVERMKDEFMGIISHELRTPITAVLGYTDILLRGMRGPLLPRQSEALEAVRNAGHRLLTLINDLLDMSRLEAGKQELSLGAVDLSAAVRQALSDVGGLAAAKEIKVVGAVPEALPPALADAVQLRRILGNLLSNAIKFTPEGGSVTVTAACRGGDGNDPTDLEGKASAQLRGLEVRISDTGIGIPHSLQETIWDKFRQADSSSRRPYGGTGLGLSIVKGLILLHGGTVWVESEGVPGRGSTFGFTLPMADASTPPM